MKRIFRIFALLFLASCGETTIPEIPPCQLMTISDALPVQFWLSDCDTYNETVPKGVHEACFCAPWQCDDEIRIQFQDDTSPEPEYSLLIKNSGGEYVVQLPFTEVEAGTFARSFTPQDYGICDEDIALEIADNDNIFPLLAPSDWDDAGASAFDSKNATTFVEALTSVDGSVSADMPLIVPAGTVVVITYTVEVTGTWSGVGVPIFVSFTLKDSGGNTASTGTLSVNDKTISANGTYQYTETLTATDTTAVLDLDLVESLSSGTANVTITITPDTILYASPSAKSDCLNIATTQDETQLFEYANGRNFAGLIYQDISPDAAFYLRVPCRFFHEEFPEEDEAIELTSQVVTTSSQLKSQKLLEVKHVPYYFHKKMQLVLKHQTLEVGNTAYKKEEKYEINKGNMRWPLKSATCLLTEKNSVLRNTL